MKLTMQIIHWYHHTGLKQTDRCTYRQQTQTFLYRLTEAQIIYSDIPSVTHWHLHSMPNTHRRCRRDETVLSRCVGGVYMNSQLAHEDCRRTRSTIWKLAKQTPYSGLTTWILIDIDNFFNSDDIMTSLLKKLSIFIKSGVIKRYGVCLVSFKIVDRIRRQSSSASCELLSHRRRRRDKTVSSRRRCVLGSSYWLTRLQPMQRYHNTRTAQTFSNHPRTPIYHFSNLTALSTIGWCPENFVMTSLTVQELMCWQTDRQSHKQTLLKTIRPSMCRG